MLAEEAGVASRLYGMDLSGIRRGEVLEMGEAPAFADLIAPLHATHHGVFAVTADRIVFFPLHGPGIGFRPNIRKEWGSGAWRIAGATAAPDGSLWVVVERGGVAALFWGNGQADNWRLRRTLLQWEISSGESAILFISQRANGPLELGFAAGGKMGVYDIGSESVKVSAAPGLQPQPITLDAKLRQGLPAMAPPYRESAQSVPVHVENASTSGVALLRLTGSVPALMPLIPEHRALASGFASNGGYIGVVADSIYVTGASVSERRRFNAGAKRFDGGEGATISAGGAGTWAAVASRVGTNTAQLEFLVPDGQREMILQMSRNLSAPNVGRSAIVPTIPPIATDDAFYLVALREDEPELLFADMVDQI